MKRRVIYVAPDKFKGMMSARCASNIIATALGEGGIDADIRTAPMADGGEGTAAVLARMLGLRPCTIAAHDALMNPCTAYYCENPLTKEVYLDCSTVLGLTLLNPSQCRARAMEASSYALGELVAKLLKRSATKVTIGLGGTASSDGGAGMLQALGVKFYDGSGRLIAHPIGGRDLINIEFVDFTGVQLDVLACRLAGLSDVDVPMVADLGRKCVSTLSFAPQKGVSEQELPLLEAGLRHWHDLAVRVFPGRGLEEYAGAAGGLGFALGRVIGADVAGGAKNLIYRYGLISPDTSLIITGEGCIDEQSMAGKVVGEIARQAKVAEIPVIAIGGRVDDSFHDRGSFAGVFSTEHYMPDAVLSPWVARQRLILAMLDVTPCVSRILNSVSR